MTEIVGAVLKDCHRRLNSTNYIGFPDGGKTQMPLADHLVVKLESDGFYLIRYAESLYAGDTWHESIDDAMHQATIEYGNEALDWKVIPQEVRTIADPVARAERIREFLKKGYQP